MNRYHAAFIPAALLVIALAHLPYGYYTFLRLIITGWTAFLAWSDYERGGRINGWAIAFAAIAVLFNPFVPVYLNPDVWRVLDLACAACFGAFAGARLATTHRGGGSRGV